METRKCSGIISWGSDSYYCYADLPGNYYSNSDKY